MFVLSLQLEFLYFERPYSYLNKPQLGIVTRTFVLSITAPLYTPQRN